MCRKRRTELWPSFPLVPHARTRRHQLQMKRWLLLPILPALDDSNKRRKAHTSGRLISHNTVGSRLIRCTPLPPPPPQKKIDIDTTGSGARLRTSLTDHVLISDIKLTRGCSLKKVVVHPKFRKIPNNLKNSENSEKIQKNPKNFEKSPKIRNKQKTRNISKKYDKSEKYEKIRKNTKNPKKSNKPKDFFENLKSVQLIWE